MHPGRKSRFFSQINARFFLRTRPFYIDLHMQSLLHAALTFFAGAMFGATVTLTIQNVKRNFDDEKSRIHRERMEERADRKRRAFEEATVPFVRE
jgi:hypothetical protein